MVDDIVFFDLFMMHLNTNIRNPKKPENRTSQRSRGSAVPVCAGRPLPAVPPPAAHGSTRKGVPVSDHDGFSLYCGA